MNIYVYLVKTKALKKLKEINMLLLYKIMKKIFLHDVVYLVGFQSYV